MPKIKYLLASFVLVAATFVLQNAAFAEKGIVFYDTITSSTGHYYPEYNMSVEGSSFNVVRLIPAQSRGDVITWGQSYSFAENTMAPRVFDGKLFTLKGWGSGTMDIQRYDPVTLAPIGSRYSFNAKLLSQDSIDDVLITGDNVIYCQFINDMWSPILTFKWHSRNMVTGVDKEMDETLAGKWFVGEGMLWGYAACDAQGNLTADGANLFFAKLDPADGKLLSFFPQAGGYFNTGSSPGQYTSWRFGINNGIVYASRVNKANNEIEVLRLDPVSGNLYSGYKKSFGGQYLPEFKIAEGKAIFHNNSTGVGYAVDIMDGTEYQFSGKYSYWGLVTFQDLPAPKTVTPPNNNNNGGTGGTSQTQASSGGGGGGGGCFLKSLCD